MCVGGGAGQEQRGHREEHLLISVSEEDRRSGGRKALEEASAFQMGRRT